MGTKPHTAYYNRVRRIITARACHDCTTGGTFACFAESSTLFLRHAKEEQGKESKYFDKGTVRHAGVDCSSALVPKDQAYVPRTWREYTPALSDGTAATSG